MKRLLRRARVKAQIEFDLLRLRLQHGRMLESCGDGSAPVVLVVSLNEHIYSLKVEGIFAKALELRGYTPVLLIRSGSRLAPRYLRLFGVRRIIELADYVTDEIAETARREAAVLVADVRSTADLAGLTFRGAEIGRFVISTVSLMLREGAVDFANRNERAMLEEQLQVAIRSTLAADAILDELKPDVVLFNERNYSAEAPLSDLALERGLNVVQWVSAFQDDALVFKRYTAETRRLHPRSLSDESWERVKKLSWTSEHDAALDAEFARRYDGTEQLQRRNQEWTRPASPAEIRRELELDPQKKTAVLFSHVLWDANMFYGQDLFESQEAWFVETVRAACANPRVNWIVKLHPSNVWKRKRDGQEGTELADLVAIREQVGELPPHVKLLMPESPISTRSLFDVADCGITIRGTVGVELPALAIPVLTAGTGFYSGRGFTVDSATAGEYLTRLGSIEAIQPLDPEQVLLARKHAYALFRLRPLRFTSFESRFGPISKVRDPLDPRFILRVRSRAELEQAPDLRRFGEWAVETRELDYLEPTNGR